MLFHFFLKKGIRRSSTAKQGRQVLERRYVCGRGRSLKNEGTSEQILNQICIFHIKRYEISGQVLQDQTMSLLTQMQVDTTTIQLM